MLKSQYKGYLADVKNWDEALSQIGEMYFSIKVPSQSNPLFDMMSNMMMGGGGGGAQKKQPRRVGASAPPPGPGVD